MSEVNLISFSRSGRPPRLTASMKLEVIATGTRNATQRRKSFAQLAREMPFSIHRTSLAKILQNAGYDRHIPRKKPHISGKNIEKRKEFSDSLKDKPVEGCFDGWIASDEMYLLAGSHYGPERVIRKADEEYHPDCIELERPGQVRLMFWGAIAYNIPCSESPFFVWEEETAKEQELALEMLAEENRAAEEEVQEAQKTWYEEEMARRKLLPKGQRPRGRPANPFKITKKRRGKTTKGGIDWFRYRESICEAKLYPFYRRLLASANRGERGPIQLIEDGAGPHRSKFLNEHHKISGIKKLSWSPCKCFNICILLNLLYTNYIGSNSYKNSIARSESY